MNPDEILLHDSIFLIGKTHKVCQDYAISGTIVNELGDIITYAIVSDGCSGSPDSDIGARILAQSAKLHLCDTYGRMSLQLIVDKKIEFYNFGSSIISRAKAIANALYLNSNCLDATLVLAFVFRDHIIIYMYGDGVIIAQDNNNSISYIQRTYLSGAPYYLSYWLDANRRMMYQKEFDNKVIINEQNAEKVEYDSEGTIAEYLTIKSLKETKSILIGSDGLSTFIKQGNDPLSLIDVSNNVTSFKNTTGEFLKRRVLKYTDDCRKAGIYHYDDIALAGFVKGGIVEK